MMLDTRALPGSPPFGREVHGVTSQRLDDPEFCKALRDLWALDGVLVFKDMDRCAALQVKLSSVFGELEQHPAKEMQVEDHPELIWITSDVDRDSIYRIDGVDTVGWLPWHSDLIWASNVSRGGLLRAVERGVGGDTGFMCRIDAYNRLTPDLKAQIEGLEVLYRAVNAAHLHAFTFDRNVERIRNSTWADKSVERILAHTPGVAHPLVTVQPETGRKTLNFSPAFAVAVLGMDESSSKALLTKIGKHITDTAYEYRHRWNDTDMLLWDNFRVNHKAYGVPVGVVRRMQRTTIAAPHALGRIIRDAA